MMTRRNARDVRSIDRFAVAGRTLAAQARLRSMVFTETILQDIRYAFRLFARKRGFTVVAVLTLALGIGANTAIFSLAHAVLLRPLPYVEPERLIHVWLERVGPVDHTAHGVVTGTHAIEWQQRSASFDSFALGILWTTDVAPQMDLVHPSGTERLRGAFVTPNFFALLGVPAAQGRTFGSQDTASDSNLVVLSDAFWRRRFGGDPAVVGASIDMISGRRNRAIERYTVIGVLPPRFRFSYPEETEIWAILPWSRIRRSDALDYQLIARLKDGVAVGAAQAELTAIARDISRAWGADEKSVRETFALVETMPGHLAAEARSGVLLLVAAAGVVMFIACVNLILLLLALMVERASEVALRAAVGATWRRIARQLLIETGVLALAGAMVGVTLAWALIPVLRAVVPPLLPRGEEVAIDPMVLAFALALTVASTLVGTLGPVWHTYKRDAAVTLRQASVSATGSRGVAVWRRGVVAAQMAVVLTLLVLASLLLHSFWRLQRVDLGFSGDGLITMEMRVLNPKYRQPGRMAEFQRAVMERVRAIPAVQQASMTSAVPFRGVDFVSVTGSKGGRRKAAQMRPIDPQYFSLMHIPVLAGRPFTTGDTAESAPVAIVSQAYARSLFGDENPLGQQLALGSIGAEIVGVVGDVRHVELARQPAPALYLPRAQHPNELMCLVVRPAPGIPDVAAAVRTAVHSVDSEQPIEKIATIDGIVRESTAEEWFYTVTTAGFGGVAIALALAGLVGVVSRSVTERAREIGIRMALGAQPVHVVRHAVREGLYPVGIGLVVGSLGAWGASRLLRGFLFEVSPVDPLAYTSAVTLLGLAASVACYLASRRATRLEPMAVLKAE